MNSRTKIFLALLSSCVFAMGLIMFPSETAQSVRNSLAVCSKNIIPSLFPFFVISKFLVSVPFPKKAERIFGKIMSLFSLSANLAPALILGLIGGYPIGASSVSEVYCKGLCTRNEAERLLAFCNNCGPAFIIGAVGFGIYSSVRIGIILFAVHVFSALAVGIIFAVFSPIDSEKIRKRDSQNSFKFSKAFTNAVSTSTFSLLTICAYIVLFSVFSELLRLMRVLPLISGLISSAFGISAEAVSSFISGVLEVTVGAYSIAECCPFSLSFPVISFLLGWGGFSVHCQAMSCISESGLSLRQHFWGKLLHGIFSLIFACGLRFII